MISNQTGHTNIDTNGSQIHTKMHNTPKVFKQYNNPTKKKPFYLRTSFFFLYKNRVANWQN